MKRRKKKDTFLKFWDDPKDFLKEMAIFASIPFMLFCMWVIVCFLIIMLP